MRGAMRAQGKDNIMLKGGLGRFRYKLDKNNRFGFTEVFGDWNQSKNGGKLFSDIHFIEKKPTFKHRADEGVAHGIDVFVSDKGIATPYISEEFVSCLVDIKREHLEFYRNLFPKIANDSEREQATAPAREKSGKGKS